MNYSQASNFKFPTEIPRDKSTPMRLLILHASAGAGHKRAAEAWPLAAANIGADVVKKAVGV